MPTRDELIELSNQVARVAGIEPFEMQVDGWIDATCPQCRSDNPRFSRVWLFEDSTRCFDLLCELLAQGWRVFGSEKWASLGNLNSAVSEHLSDHNNDRKQATCTAILRGYLAMKGEKK